ncbi:glycosyltransferase family 4 protein [Niallia alba]|uniref:Glycosyltransferase family 4 protein n=1 Tax=Niallia alba TaxID=2729105 RepID=A0A7Y0PP62_9BACI|nr:glycosyltransferase family 1 protein [Niallia alba]NMO79580.1 glycosyltransferase family 4 protein [Niallia alba]
MKQIYINGRFLTQTTTGVQRVAEEIVKRLDELITNKVINDHYFTILTPKDKIKDLKLKNINVKSVGYLKGHAWEQLELPCYSKREILVNFCNTAPVYKKNQIIYVHDAAILDAPEGFTPKFIKFYNILFQSFAKRAKKIITVSNFSKNRLEHYFPNMKGKVSVSYLGTEHISKIKSIENDFLKNNNLVSNEYYLAVSSANPNKNFQVIIDMLSIIDKPIEKFVIVGGKSSKVFKDDGANQSQYVTKLGYVSDEELITLYKNAKVFLFPSKYEGFGLPPLEAMSLGTPVIAANSASIPEILKNNALFFQYNDPKELLQKIRSLSENEILVEELSLKGLEYAQQFSWNLTAKHLYNIIKEIK